MASDPLDFLEQDGKEEQELRAPTQEDLSKISKMAKDARHLEERIKKGQELLQLLNEEHEAIVRRELPSLMQEVGMKSFTLDTGEAIELKEELKVSIAEKNRRAAHQWLRDNDGADIIKNVVSASFGKGEDEEANKLYEKLVEDGLTAEQKESVHWKTLQSFVKNLRQEGKPVDTELLGVFEYTVAKIKY